MSLTNTVTNVESRSTTNEAGLYVFPAVLPGPCRVVVNPCMAKFEATITVGVQQSTDVEVTLSPVGTQTIVKVEDAYSDREDG